MHSSGKTPEYDGQTNRQISSSYYSGLHCEQCGRAVKRLSLTLLVFSGCAALAAAVVKNRTLIGHRRGRQLSFCHW